MEPESSPFCWPYQEGPMPSTTRRVVVEFWHFRCPDCGIGDGEAGHHATMDMILCEVCLEDGQHVRLRREAGGGSAGSERGSWLFLRRRLLLRGGLPGASGGAASASFPRLRRSALIRSTTLLRSGSSSPTASNPSLLQLRVDDLPQPGLVAVLNVGRPAYLPTCRSISCVARSSICGSDSSGLHPIGKYRARC